MDLSIVFDNTQSHQMVSLRLEARQGGIELETDWKKREEALQFIWHNLRYH